MLWTLHDKNIKFINISNKIVLRTVVLNILSLLEYCFSFVFVVVLIFPVVFLFLVPLALFRSCYVRLIVFPWQIDMSWMCHTVDLLCACSVFDLWPCETVVGSTKIKKNYGCFALHPTTTSTKKKKHPVNLCDMRMIYNWHRHFHFSRKIWTQIQYDVVEKHGENCAIHYNNDCTNCVWRMNVSGPKIFSPPTAKCSKLWRVVSSST